MATIRQRENKYQVRFRKNIHKSVSKAPSSVSVARSWAKAIGADIEPINPYWKSSVGARLFFFGYKFKVLMHYTHLGVKGLVRRVVMTD